ncbi:MAG: hypothetical protein IJ106_15920 [Parasporobacterium sp.]|nr:hypothetical protein [Parasporobacterium sp.]
MAIYLLDFENVHDSGINGVTALTEKDELCIFYSEKSEHMSFDTHVNIMKSLAKVKYIKLRRSAKNYLDFQLVTHLGYIIGAGMEGPFYIISKDTGYDSAIDYWKDHGITVLRQPAIGYNRSLGKSTGQNPAHKTPPAQVTFRQGTQVTKPNVVELYLTDRGGGLSNASEKTGSENTENTLVPDQTAAAQSSSELMSSELTADEQNIPEWTESESVEKAEVNAEADTAAAGATAAEAESMTAEESLPQEIMEIPADTPQPSRSSNNRSRSRKNNSRKQEQGKPEQVNPEQGKQEQTKQEQLGNEKARQEDSAKDPESRPAAGPDPEDERQEEVSVILKPDTLPEAYRKRVRTALKGKNIPSAYYSSIYKAIINSYDKLALNNLLVKTFGSSKGGEVYNLIKDIFRDFQS